MTSRISLIAGDNRRQNIVAALDAIADDVQRLLNIDHILVKPNLVTADNPLAVTHVDAVRAVLGWLRARTDAHIVVGEGTALSSTWAAFRAYGYLPLPDEYRNVELMDLNADQAVELNGYDWRLRPRKFQASRTATQCPLRISVGPPKTHDVVLVTLGLKNMVMGGLVSQFVSAHAASDKSRPSAVGRAIHSGEAFYNTLPAWLRNSYTVFSLRELAFANFSPSSKAAMHQGFPTMHLNLFTMAPHLYPHVSIVDGYEAMEGNGPSDGDPVAWHVAFAGSDWLAVDVTVARLMGFALEEVGYLLYCAQANYGAHRPADIQVVGNVAPDQVKRHFKRHACGGVQNRWHSPAVSRQVQMALAAKS
jgi:uncharacterized protein (DUF362 family)